MGNGVWTVEIIPAEIKPPARSRAGASGIRVRFADRPVTNMGDEADLVVAFNEQVLYGRIAAAPTGPGTVVLLESKWAEDPRRRSASSTPEALAELRAPGLEVLELPTWRRLPQSSPDARLVGKNMFVSACSARSSAATSRSALERSLRLLGRKGRRWSRPTRPWCARLGLRRRAR
jgi:2-oxoglutarate/2-oxoacid ferredoxin oxidoreductase subunit alpha